MLADKPPQPIDKGLPGPGLLAQTITSKFSDHLPLYRLEDIFARHGVELSRATLCGWMASCAELIAPLYDLMVKRVLLSGVIHTDDTKVPVWDPTLPQTRTGRFWVYVGDMRNPYVVYDYTPRRTRDGPETFLLGSVDEATDRFDVITPESPLGRALAGARPGSTIFYTAGPNRTLRATVVAVE